MYHLVVTLKW